MPFAQRLPLLVNEGARWFYLAILVFAPWAFGCTRPWTIQVLDVLMASAILLWLLGRGLRRTPPVTSPVCVGCVLFLLLLGWWMVLNAKGIYDASAGKLNLAHPLISAAPGSVERGFSIAAMERLTGLLGLLCMTVDLSQKSVWRWRIWWTMALTGISIILFGLAARFEGATMTSWETLRESHTFFATYLYHGNAGAFINLVFPVIAGFAIVAFHNSGRDEARGLWLPAVFVCIAGAFVNVSRAAQLVTVLLAVSLVCWQMRNLLSRHVFSTRDSILAGSGALAALCVVGLVGWVSVAPRWGQISSDLATGDGRTFAWQVGSRMIPDAGPLGFGPGTFEISFLFYITPEDAARLGNDMQHWRYAHEDYLQTMIEWGWVGAGVWGILFVGGLVTGLATFLRDQRLFYRADRILLFSSLLAMTGVALHALVDFPLQIASLQLYAVVHLGMLWGSRRWSGQTIQTEAA